MNLYLLIAFALGAITGIREVPVARPSFAAVVAKSSVRAERRVARTSCAAGFQPASLSATKRRLEAGATRIAAPLTGAASPRAPAWSC
jgi:hypothetical protein